MNTCIRKHFFCKEHVCKRTVLYIEIVANKCSITAYDRTFPIKQGPNRAWYDPVIIKIPWAIKVPTPRNTNRQLKSVIICVCNKIGTTFRNIIRMGTLQWRTLIIRQLLLLPICLITGSYHYSFNKWGPSTCFKEIVCSPYVRFKRRQRIAVRDSHNCLCPQMEHHFNLMLIQCPL